MATPAKYVWRPTCGRTVKIDGFAPVPRGSTTPVLPVLIWPVKDPGDVLDYVFDISEAMIGDDGDSIALLDVQISPANPGDLVLQSAFADGEKVVLWLAAGQSGTTYSVTVSVTTNAGRTLSRSITLPVVSIATPGLVVGTIVDQNGNPILDQNGNPITIGS